MPQPLRCLLAQGYLDAGFGDLWLHYVHMELYEVDLSEFIRSRPSEGIQEEVIWTITQQITSACLFLKSEKILDFTLSPKTGRTSRRMLLYAPLISSCQVSRRYKLETHKLFFRFEITDRRRVARL